MSRSPPFRSREAALTLSLLQKLGGNHCTVLFFWASSLDKTTLLEHNANIGKTLLLGEGISVITTATKVALWCQRPSFVFVHFVFLAQAKEKNSFPFTVAVKVRESVPGTFSDFFLLKKWPQTTCRCTREPRYLLSLSKETLHLSVAFYSQSLWEHAIWYLKQQADFFRPADLVFGTELIVNCVQTSPACHGGVWYNLCGQTRFVFGCKRYKKSLPTVSSSFSEIWIPTHRKNFHARLYYLFVSTMANLLRAELDVKSALPPTSPVF